MSKHPIAVRPTRIAKRAQESSNQPISVEQSTSWFSLRYSSVEISAVGPAVCIKRREARFEDGKLHAEEFEGTLDRNAYDSYLRDFHDRLLQQMSVLTRSMLWFLPQRDSGERDR